MNPTRHPTPSRQRGIGLVEALIAFLLLTLGMLTVVRLQPMLRLQAEHARQRSEAARLAQEDIERLRSFARLTATPGLRSFDTIAATTTVVDESTASTRYDLQREVDTTSWPNTRGLTVTVRWNERDGQPQVVQLATLIAANDPALAGAAMLAR